MGRHHKSLRSWTLEFLRIPTLAFTSREPFWRRRTKPSISIRQSWVMPDGWARNEIGMGGLEGLTVWRFDGSSWKSWPVRPSGRFHSGLGMCLDGWRLRFQVVFRHLYGFIIFTLRSKLMAQIPKGKLVKGQCKPICRDCAMGWSGRVQFPSGRDQTACSWLLDIISGWEGMVLLRAKILQRFCVVPLSCSRSRRITGKWFRMPCMVRPLKDLRCQIREVERCLCCTQHPGRCFSMEAEKKSSKLSCRVA